MRILVTNDDGIEAAGLAALAAAAEGDGHEVVVVAPSAESSGSASSLGVIRDRNRVTVSARDIRGLSGIAAFAVDAPPALGVRAACSGAFGWKPDLVVSGINPGFNTGRLVLHSGTVGAALTAASLDVCAAAFSTEAQSVLGLDTTSRVATSVIGGLLDAGLPPVAVNVNVPALPFPELKGLSFADPGPVSCDDVAFDFEGNSLALRRRRNPPPYDDRSDAGLVARGLISVTVLALPWRTDANAESRVVAAIERRWIQASASCERANTTSACRGARV
ncbi:5'/3'-nucleotidase SurE [Rhodococcus sp. USK10]|uniref:5'/3'-nucleotidase SurE n=1 Tax=Rhodococcus sp. USK10 TaxID=2789739 RepID=UPI001C607BD3|nr:5'/3'-nucleotidase SurE [Rhodococcus sp. USK10]QYB06758.1 5'/3'-nucleotidase SurE [Rhodococcus sp. USK10]